MGKSLKDKRDIYYRLAKEQGYRARSAYKLLQLDDRFNLFQNASRVVDLCAAPGSWSQVLSRSLVTSKSQVARTGNPQIEVKIVAIDIQPMAALPGIISLQADITEPFTLSLLLHHLGSKTANVDLVVSDGAPDVTGLHDLDEFLQAQLLLAALNLATCVLRVGGTFVAKIFKGREVDELYCQLRNLFRVVTIAKPSSSRESSNESFVVCQDYAPPTGFTPSLENPLGTMMTSHNTSEYLGNKNWNPAFIACGDLSAWDAQTDCFEDDADNLSARIKALELFDKPIHQ